VGSVWFVGESRVVTLPDGRDLGWMEVGDVQGTPVVAFHGTPGSRREIVVRESIVRELGVRLICVDRPGYGLSSFHARRRLIDWPDDVAFLLNHLDVHQFSVLGHSGGGPHALACAALFGERLKGVATLGGIAPLDYPRALTSFSRANQRFMVLARKRSPLVGLVSSAQMTVFHRWPSVALKMLVRQLPAPDVAIVSRPEVRDMFVGAARRTSRSAARAVAQDFELFSAPWGFELSSIRTRVHLWHGDLDRNVPIEHARIMHDELADSILHELAGAGHLFIYNDLEEVLRTLVVP
jgi:pimeloyl-ACP methyl ester carboxylesterase